MKVIGLSDGVRKQQLQVILKGLVSLAGLMIVYVLIDYSFRQAEPPVYRFRLPVLELDRPVIVAQGNLMLIVTRFSSEKLRSLDSERHISAERITDQKSDRSVSGAEFYVARAYGTHIGCPLEIVHNGYKESCSNAHYDQLGRSANPGLYSDLETIDYYLNRDFTILTTE